MAEAYNRAVIRLCDQNSELKRENAKLKQEVADLSDIISMLKKGMERHANCPSCKAREPQLRPK